MYVREYLKLGIPVYTNKSVVNKVGSGEHNLITVEALKTFQVGSFKVMAFNCQHDVETFGFLIDHPSCGKTLFATDTFYIKYKFKGLNNIIIEANYSKKIIEEKSLNNETSNFLRDRVFRSHMSIENCVEFLKSNDLNHTENIVLIHLSDRNSNEKHFKSTVEQATGKKVTIADKGISIPFNKYPF
jgi:hypothetical protein